MNQVKQIDSQMSKLCEYNEEINSDSLAIKYEIPEWFLANYYNTTIKFNADKIYHMVLLPGKHGTRYFEKLDDAMKSIKDMIDAPKPNQKTYIQEEYKVAMDHSRESCKFIARKSTSKI